MREEATSDVSLDSEASTTASGVLIASTSVHMTGPLSQRAAGGGSRQKRTADNREVLDGLMLDMGSYRSPAVSGVSLHYRSAKGSLRKSFSGVMGEDSPCHSQSRDLSQSSVRLSGQKIPGMGGDGRHEPSNLRSPEDGEGSAVHISVKRLREIPAPLPDFTMKKRDPTYIPPALPANKYPPVTFSHTEGPSDAVGISTVQKNESSKFSFKSPKVVVTKHFQDVTDRNVTKSKQEAGINTKKDVQISQFTTGQKETLLAVLNKRVHSGPVTKEVRVHLLDDAATKSKVNHSADKKVDCAEVHSATVAAATAAAIAAAAPVLKVQSDLEAQVSSVSQLLHKLQEADRQLQRLTEQQDKMAVPPTHRPYQQERVSELEKQLTLLTEQRLQHLEKLQQQQLEMQSHFISSAMKASAIPPQAPASVCVHPLPNLHPVHGSLDTASSRITGKADQPATTDSGTSPLETPAPRRFAPRPISMDVQPPPNKLLGKENVEDSKNPKNAGKVHFLQQVLGNDGTTWSDFRTNTPLNLTTGDDSLLQNVRAGTSKGTSFPSSTAVQKADDVLQDLNSLKKDMQNMMKDARLWSQERDMKLGAPPSMASTSLKAPHLYRCSAVNPPKSMFEDAERVLREVQSNRKVLDENLEAIIRAKDGAAMYSLISALTTNGCGAEKIRIQKAVDSLISGITCEIQDELAKKEMNKKRPEVQEPSLRRTAGSKDVKNNREGEIKAPTRSALNSTKHLPGVPAKVQCKHSKEKPTGPQSRTSLKKDAGLKVPQKVDESSMKIDEEALNRVYGTPLYQGHRSTLKKGPYLRHSSPSPKSKPRRPKVVETVKGVKVKSEKVQTSLSEVERPVVMQKPPEFSVLKNYEPQYVFTPSADPGTLSVPMEGHLIPMAIPLGRSRLDTAPPLPSAVILARPQPVTVNVSVPPQSPKRQAKVEKPKIAIVEMKCEKKEPPQLSVQVLPCVDIDSIVSDSPSTSQMAPSVEMPLRTPSPVKPDIQLSENVETEEEIVALPGSSFQDTDFPVDEELNEAPEPLLELDGWGEVTSPQHGGIPFPPPAPAPHAPTDILDGIIHRKESLENRLVSWVEQEIMARVISEMLPVRQDPIHDVTSSSSDPSEMASDIVEAAGGKGLQLFVDASVPVDSNLIREYVNEALAETIAIMLGEREAHHAPAPRLKPPDLQPEPVEIAAVPTPRCTPPTSPLLEVEEPSLVKTPEISPQASIEESEVLQKDPDESVQRNLPVHIDTPTVTPVPSPPRVATPTPVLMEENEDPSVVQSASAGPWGIRELPLEEENPHSVKEIVEYKDAVVMTVAADEEPSIITRASSPESEKAVPELPKQRTPSPVPSSPDSAPSTDESSLTIAVTETDTTDKPISEGEIIYSYGQIAAAQAIAEGGIVYPNLADSLSSTLKDAHDMEFDPPSEGQVIPGPHGGAHRDPVLSLIATFNQDLVAPQEAFFHLESSGEDSSMGEISEGQRPRLTTAAEQVLVGHSVLMGRPSNAAQTSRLLQNRSPSPGQYAQGEAEQTSSGPMSIRDLDSHHLTGYYPRTNNVYQTPSVPRDTVQGPGQPQREHQPAATRLIQVGVKPAEGPHQAPDATQEDTERTRVEPRTYLPSVFPGEFDRPTKNMSVTLPTMSEASEERRSPFAESDSSGTDTF
ncbi:protein TALPID3 [Gastrophryne carolinensis]